MEQHTRPLENEPAARLRADTAAWLAEWRWWLAGTVVLVGWWGLQSLMAGTAGTFWPALPLGVWALVLVAVAIVPAAEENG